MKLATLDDGTIDGALHVVSRDLRRAVSAAAVARTMQDALDNWTGVAPALEALAADLAAGRVGEALALADARAPLPRAWQWLDGSAYQSHGDLMAAVFHMDKNQTDIPLMYQGTSDRFYGPCEDVPFADEADGIDFEGEFGVIVDAVPMGVSVAEAERHIRLIVQINDWSLRRLAPREMKTGFGWIQAKPPCSAAPVAVTPDELGAGWRDGRVALPLTVSWNDAHFGAPDGYQMLFSLPELVAHAARTRRLCAGTIIGTGTVSNPDFREVGSTCIAERRGIETIDEGAPRTDFMKFGDRVRMDVFGPDGQSVFGAIDQRVVKG